MIEGTNIRRVPITYNHLRRRGHRVSVRDDVYKVHMGRTRGAMGPTGPDIVSKGTREGPGKGSRPRE